MTEQEATKKGCPLFCVVTAIAAHVPNFEFQNKTPGNCQGSECMMWRWDDASTYKHTEKSSTHGYCGLAGR